MALFGKFPFAKVPVFMIAQYCGAFTGALLVFLVYRSKKLIFTYLGKIMG